MTNNIILYIYIYKYYNVEIEDLKRELKTSISDNEWKQSFKDIMTYTRPPYWQEDAWKVIFRYIETPLTTFKYSQISPVVGGDVGETTRITYSTREKLLVY